MIIFMPDDNKEELCLRSAFFLLSENEEKTFFAPSRVAGRAMCDLAHGAQAGTPVRILTVVLYACVTAGILI